MLRPKRVVFLLFGLIIFIYIMIHGSKPEEVQKPTSDSNVSIKNGNFTCQTWKDLSYLDEHMYRECLKWISNTTFWDVQNLRHTMHKGLLDSTSLIVEVGGNVGHDTMRFIELYNASIISYEPLQQMWKDLTVRFRQYPRVEFHPFGLGSRARSVLLEPNDGGNAGTSVFRPLTSPNSTKIQRIYLLDAVQVIREIQQTRTTDGMIDMLSINCEGCEFEILPALILNDMIRYFRIIQFGSHISLVPDSSCIYCQIEQALAQTHVIKYHYAKLWEGWVHKDMSKNSLQ